MRRGSTPVARATSIHAGARGRSCSPVPCAAIGAAPAQAAVSQKVTAATAVDRSCHAKYAGGAAGTQTVTATAPATGLVRARLSGAGDWDLGVFDFSSGRTIAGSAGFASNELAEGFVKKGQKLRVQACRFRGSASSADLSIGFVAIAERATGKVQIVDVSTATRKEKRRLQALGLDLTEHGDAQLRRGRPARHGRRAQAARRRLHLRRPDRRPRGALEDQHRRRREVRGVEPEDAAAQRQQRLPPSRGLQPRAQAARDALSGARQGADAQPPDRRGPRRQRHRDHARTPTRRTASRSSCSSASTTRVSGRRRSTRSSSRTTW